MGVRPVRRARPRSRTSPSSADVKVVVRSAVIFLGGIDRCSFVGTLSRTRQEAARTAWAGSASSTGETASIPSASSTRWNGGSTPTCSCAHWWAIEHVAGARRARGRRRPCDDRAGTDERRHDVHLHLRRGVRFGPPVNREITSRDIRYALERHVRPDSGHAVSASTSTWSGASPRRDGADDRLQPRTARRRLPAPSHPPRGGPDPTRDRSLLGGEARPLLPDADLVGPVHGPGLRRAPLPPVLHARTAPGALGRRAHARSQSELRPQDGLSCHAREQSRSVRLRRRRVPGRVDRQEAEGGSARRRDPLLDAERARQTHAECRPARPTEGQFGRLGVLRLDEPDEASVRRRARAEGDELGDGQGSASRGVRRAAGRPDRAPPHPGRPPRRPPA